MDVCDTEDATNIAGSSQAPDGCSMPKRKLHIDAASHCQKKPNILPSEEEIYKQSGVKSSFHGVAYQWKLLMLFAVRAHRNGYSFRLATEMDEAEKFDDIVFQYIKSDEQIMMSKFLQAKHIEIQSQSKNQIKTNDLMTETDERFSLQKYFHSFQKILSSNLTNCESNTNDFIICTNIGFDFDQTYIDPTLKRLRVSRNEKHIYFESVKIEDEILREDGNFYRVVSNATNPRLRTEIVTYLRETFQKTSDMNRLATNLTENICSGKSIDLKDKLMKQYNKFLISTVIDAESSSISKKFLDQNNDKVQIRQFRLALLKAVKVRLVKSNNIPKNKLTFNMKILRKKLNISKMSEDEELSTIEIEQIKMNLCKIQLNISAGFKNVFIVQENPHLHDPYKTAVFLATKINTGVYSFEVSNNDEMKDLKMLAGHILVLKNHGIGFCQQFYSDKLLPGNLKQFKTYFSQNLGIACTDMSSILENITLEIKNYVTCSEEDGKIYYPEEISDIDKQINSFLDHLLFAVNQPNEQKLTEVILAELGEEFSLIDSRFITSDFEVHMIDWLKEKQGQYLSENKIYLKFSELKQRLLETIFNGNTTLYQNKRLAIDLGFENIQIGIREFLEEDASECSNEKLYFPLKMKPNSIKIGTSIILQEVGQINYYKKTGSFIFLKFNDFRRHETEILASLKNKNWKLLILECKDKSFDVNPRNDDFVRRFESIFNVEHEERKKLIVIASTFHPDVKYVELNLEFQNLKKEAQKIILDRIVMFQGHEIPLGKLVCNDQQVENFIPIFETVGKLTYHIDKVISLTEGYDADYFIERTLTKQIFVKQEVNIDEDVLNGTNIIAKTENEFTESLLENCNRNIHLLTLTEKPNVLFWQKTHGNISLVRKYLSDDVKHIDVSRQLFTEFVNEAHQRKTIIIADTAGMGKTSIFTHICLKLKNARPHLWISRIDLNLFTSELNSLTSEGTKDINLEFLCGQILKLKNVFENKLFNSMLQHGNVILFFDGFDEISPHFKYKTLALIRSIRETNVKQIWISTRPNLKDLLEENFQQLSYFFQPFSPEEQTTFIEKFWKKKLSIEPNLHTEIIKKNASSLLAKWRESVSENHIEFAGIPLQTRMLAEAFELEIKTLIENDEIDQSKDFPGLPEKLDILNLFEKFVDRKYLIYVSNKSNSLIVNIATQDIIAILKDGVNLRKIHQRLSIKTLFSNKQDIFSLANKELEIAGEKLTRIGIVHIDKTMHYFTHKTFAEYFTADFIMCKLNKRMPVKFHIFLIEEILMKDEYQIIRIFMDRLLLRHHIESKEMLQQIGNAIAESWLNGNLKTPNTTLLHLNIKENNENIANFLLFCCFSVSNTKNTELHRAYKEMLYDNSGSEGNVWHFSIIKGYTDILESLWIWSKQILSREEQINYIKDGNLIVWDSVYLRHDAIVVKLRKWASEINFNEEELFAIILTENDTSHYFRNFTPWHYAVIYGSLEMLQAIYDLCPETNRKQLLCSTLRNKQRNMQFHQKINAFHIACSRGEIEILKKLWNFIKECIHTERDRENFLDTPQKFSVDLSDDWETYVACTRIMSKEEKKTWVINLMRSNHDVGNCGVHLVATCFNFEPFRFVVNCYEEVGKGLRDILALQNNRRETILHLLAKGSSVEFLKPFAELLTQKIDSNVLLELLQLKNHKGENILKVAESNEDFRSWLCELSKKIGVDLDTISS